MMAWRDDAVRKKAAEQIDIIAAPQQRPPQ
jgi:hypothetical protein